MRKGRLFQVLCYLLEKGQGTAAEIAREFDVSVRTVYRDVETLNSVGIPIYAETGRSGGICLMKGFVLDRAMLDREERGRILEALMEHEEEFSSPGPSTLPKLAALFELPAADCLEVDLSGGGAPKAEERFQFLQRAVTQHHCAELTYMGPGGEPSRLTVKPLKLCCLSGGWYLKACCEGGYRMLALPRIAKWKPSVDTFDPHAYPDAAPAPQPEPARVLVRFPETLADRVYDMFDSTLITPRKDGFLDLRIETRPDDRLIGRLLALGPDAVVASPASLREELSRRVKELCKAYK